MEKIFIYLIIFVVMILFSARQNKKKQEAAKLAMLKKQQHQQNQQNASEQHQKPESLEDVFKKLGSNFLFPSAPSPSPDVYIPEDTMEDPFLNFEQPTPALKVVTNKIETKKVRKENLIDEINDSEKLNQTIDFQFDNIDEMKKAIIYSEIINRKYA